MKENHNVPYAVYTIFFTKNCPNYFDEIYVPLETNGVHTRSSYQKLNAPHQRQILDKKPYLMLVPRFGTI